MARKITTWSNMPKALRGHGYDETWTKKGQVVARRMIDFICEAMAIPDHRLFEIPRVVVYKGLDIGNKMSLPMSHAGAILFEKQNFVALQVPESAKRIEVNEYEYLSHSKIIGDKKLTRWKAFLMDLAHEIAHWMVYRLLGRRRVWHGNLWRVCYALLREKFVNK